MLIAASFTLGYVEIFPPWFMIPVAGKTGAGVILGLAANGLSIVAWVICIADLLARRWAAGRRPAAVA